MISSWVARGYYSYAGEIYILVEAVLYCKYKVQVPVNLNNLIMVKKHTPGSSDGYLIFCF